MTDPVFDSFPDDITTECNGGVIPNPPVMPVASDDVDPIPTVTYVDTRQLSGCGRSATFIRTWTATDRSGNSISRDQTITLEDTTPPQLILPPDIAGATLGLNTDPYTNTGLQATAIDTCSEDVDVSYTNVIHVGENITWTWMATDECGNKISTDQIITLVPSIEPQVCKVTCDGKDDNVAVCVSREGKDGSKTRHSKCMKKDKRLNESFQLTHVDAVNRLDFSLKSLMTFAKHLLFPLMNVCCPLILPLLAVPMTAMMMTMMVLQCV